MVKTIALDLDGTLLDDNKKIGTKAKENILRLKKEGINIVLASGRHYRDMAKYITELELDEKDYVICCDGQYVLNSDGQILWNNIFIENNDINEIISRLKLKRGFLFTNDTDMFFYKGIIQKIIAFGLYLLKKIKPISISRICSLECEKIRLFRDDVKENDFENIRKSYTAHIVFDRYIDITQNGVNKYEALKVLENMKKIEIKQLLYFGDDYNDEECFANIENSVAMKNSCHEILECAKIVTESNNEDGVGRILSMIDKGNINEVFKRIVR